MKPILSWLNSDNSYCGVCILQPRGCQKGIFVPITPRSSLIHLSPMLAFSMIKLEITVDIGQRLIKAAFFGRIGDMMHIQEDFLPFMQSDQSFMV